MSERTAKLVADVARGDRAAADELLPLVYEELREIAERLLHRERVDHTLQPTALVHEAYVRLVVQEDADWRSRAHFVAVAAEAIRRVLVDHARRRGAAKRGGGWERVTLGGLASDGAGALDVDLVALDGALTRLRTLNPRHFDVVTLRFFGGLTAEETAHVLDTSRMTIARDWRVARAWLLAEIEGADADGGGVR